MPALWLVEAVATFGGACKAKLAGPGDEEAAIRSPLEQLLAAAGVHFHLTVVPHDEVRDTARGVRPDYAISVGGAITGYLEVKKPGADLDPASFSGHNLQQWTRQRDLPNLIYTNGTSWRLYRDSEQVGDPVHLQGGPLKTAGNSLTAGDDLEVLLIEFLRWEPAPITSVGALVKAVAPLTRLLRGEVLDQLDVEERANRSGRPLKVQPFTGLAKDWRQLLFPTASNATFADGYAQTVTFALLLARTEGIDLTAVGSLHEVGTKLAGQHSLMSRALQLLTDYVSKDFAVTLDLLVRVIGAVDWPKVRKGRRDTYLHLYENFLHLYDDDLQQLSGSYYTPRPLVEQMVRLAEDVLVTRLGKTGFNDEDVTTVDPAMGTGTYLHTIIEHVAREVEAADGSGAIGGAIQSLARRLYGFEIQMGPYAVAELRTADLMADLGAPLPAEGLGLFVTDTLGDPYADQVQLGSGLELISSSMTRANRVKAKRKVTVVIGNPPYRERAEGLGGWIENGTIETTLNRAIHPLDAFRAADNGRNEYVLKNLYIYFWRWATWKVFDANRDQGAGDSGIVCFVTTSGYLRGPGFKGMREYLRRTCSEGWIIDLSPEGMRPDVSTRVFKGVQQTLAIAIFVRKTATDPNMPATLHHAAVHGKQSQKFAELAALGIDSEAWRPVRSSWQAPFTPAATTGWDTMPALNDLFPWSAPGVKANRGWVYAPAISILRDRWLVLRDADRATRPSLFKDSRDSALSKAKDGLAGVAVDTTKPLDSDFPVSPVTIRAGYRALDRQYLIADMRVIDQPRPPLWSARIDGQIFVIEQHADVISDGPGVLFSALIPDMHLFNNRGGRALPLLHPNGLANVAPGIIGAISYMVGESVSAQDLAAYVAGVAAHPAFTERFTDELTTPGIRVPITANAQLWHRAVAIGKQVIWLQTYGARYNDTFERLADDIRLNAADDGRITNLVAITDMPNSVAYDPITRAIKLGDGTFGPVNQEVWDYKVGGREVIKSWIAYRKAVPGGRKTSPLDHMHLTSWPSAWTAEFIDLLTVLTRLVRLEPGQAALLDQIVVGPLITRDQLAASGVTWPGATADPLRSPRYEAVEVQVAGEQLGFDI